MFHFHFVSSSMLVPAWIESLLSTEFFSTCSSHREAPRSECNMFCLDCRSDAFCYYCRSSRHKEHRVIQIRRSSYHDVVRVSEVQKVLDLAGVQTYVINSARVMFLNERPQPKTSAKAVSHLCEICSRSLLDPFRFCSLGCKLKGIKRSGDATFVPNGEMEEGVNVKEEETTSYSPPAIAAASNANSRRRKGKPQRAPLGWS